MPSITEILKAEGVEVTPELESKLPTLLEASDEVRNLVSTKDDLHKWKQDNAEKVAGYDLVQEERNTALEEAKTLAQKNGDLEGYLAAEKAQVALKDETIKARNETALKGTLEASELEIASLFNCPDTGRSLAKGFVSADIGEDGNVNKSYKLNGETYNSFDEFKEASSKVDWIAKQMKGPESKGPQFKSGDGNGSYEKKNFNGSKQERVAAAVSANPKLSELPLN